MAYLEPTTAKIKDGRILKIYSPRVDQVDALYECVIEILKDSKYVLSVPDTMRNKSQEERLSFITSHGERASDVLLVGELDGKIVSILNFKNFLSSKIKHRGEFGCSVLKEYWSLGINTAMIQRLLVFVKDQSHLKQIELHVMSENIPAIQCYKKCGFVEVGRNPNAYLVDDRYVDGIHMIHQIGK